MWCAMGWALSKADELVDALGLSRSILNLSLSDRVLTILRVSPVRKERLPPGLRRERLAPQTSEP